MMLATRGGGWGQRPLMVSPSVCRDRLGVVGRGRRTSHCCNAVFDSLEPILKFFSQAREHTEGEVATTPRALKIP